MAVNLDAYTVTHSITNVQITKDLETSDPTMFACVRVPNRAMHVDDVRLNREVRVYMDPSDGSKLIKDDPTDIPVDEPIEETPEESTEESSETS